jgi:MOSC domain-containing protein YiiM
MPRLLSVDVGLPRDIVWNGRTVHTGIWKNPVIGRCRVARLNLEGDGQGDLAGHGGGQSASGTREMLVLLGLRCPGQDRDPQRG